MRAVFLGGIGAALTLLAATGMAETAFYLAMAFSVGEIASLCAADLYYIGCAATALCVALGWNGVFSALYCAWGVICALLFAPGRRSGREWLCALLCALQGLCGLLLAVKGVLAVPLACALLLPMALLLRGALYAAWLPLRAWFIRRRAGR